MYKRLISITLALLITVIAGATDNNSGLKYTKDHPLVYEDLLDLPPFSYVNDEGKPDGFNIALVKEMMKRLGVPYVIKLKHTPLNFQDVSNGTAALTIGMKAPYHDKYGAYSANTRGKLKERPRRNTHFGRPQEPQGVCTPQQLQPQPDD